MPNHYNGNPENTGIIEGSGYKIAVSNEPYHGKVVKIGNDFFTTTSGTFEGNSQRLIVNDTGAKKNIELSTETENGDNVPRSNQRDIVTTFVVGDNTRFGMGTYYYGDGTKVLSGTQLHHHTIPPNGRNNFMTQHTMDGNEEDVYTTIRGRSMPPVNTQTQRRTQNQRRTQTRRRNGGMSGGGTGGGY